MVRISDHPHKMFEKSLHRRNVSEEIDVFEAAKYFSGTNEIYPKSSAPIGLKDRQCSKQGGIGISLDMPMRKGTQTVAVVKENQSKEKKHKQPSSPGGRIAKILNALFNQTSLKKGKSKTWSAKSVKDDDETTPDWRRKRRSSISNFQPEHNSSQSFNSGFRTPPAAYAQTRKASSSYKDFRSYSDHKEIPPYALKNNRYQNPALISIGLVKGEINLKHGFVERFDVEEDRYSPQPEERELTKFSEADCGADSDSSSDLFDLPNCDRNLYSSELPVYESTHIESIKTNTR